MTISERDESLFAKRVRSVAETAVAGVADAMLDVRDSDGNLVYRDRDPERVILLSRLFIERAIDELIDQVRAGEVRVDIVEEEGGDR